MTIEATLVKALHNASVTRLIALYLRHTHRVPFIDFYGGLIDEFFARCAPCDRWHRRLLEHYERFLTDAETTDHIEVEELPRLPFLLDPSRWLFAQVCLEFDRFFDVLGAYLLATYPAATNLAGAIDYQRNLVILPTYDRAIGKTFQTEADWISYFDQTRGRVGSEWLPEPDPVPGAAVDVSDQACGEQTYSVHPLEWGNGDWQDRWIAWVRRTVLHRNSASKNNFQKLILRAPGPVTRVG
jgi:putative methyltransferase